MTRADLERIAGIAKDSIDDPIVEKIIREQNEASLRSPGVETHYYRLLYRLAQEMHPTFTLELGTHTGISAMCLAVGYPQGRVATVNIVNELRDDCRRSNIDYRYHDSLVDVGAPGPIDILFLDTWHDGIRPLREYELYEQRVLSPGGVIMFDDIHLLPCMREFWKAFEPVRGEKFELPVHGEAGFGVVLL